MCYPDLEGFVGGEVTVGLGELFLVLFFAFTLLKGKSESVKADCFSIYKPSNSSMMHFIPGD